LSGVFINYRSTDNPLGAAGIHDELVRRFGTANVFRDCVSLQPGSHYPSAIRKALADADLLIAVIGPQWLTLTDPTTGQRLIDRDHDWVRRELAWAFQHGIQVVPVLLHDTPTSARQPKLADLPDDIKPLATIQALTFSQRRFRTDLDRLTTTLCQLLPTLPNNGTHPPTNGTRQLPAAALAELVTVLEAIPTMQGDATRSLLISQLRPAISGAIPHYPQRRAHIMGILTTCLNYEQGLPDLITALRHIEQPDSLPFQRLLQTLTHLLPEA
jgi:hypothetical protein